MGYKKPPGGTAPIFTSGCYQLDVDSVVFPSLSPKSSSRNKIKKWWGFTSRRFFQDNDMREVEVFFIGNFSCGWWSCYVNAKFWGKCFNSGIVLLMLKLVKQQLELLFGVAQGKNFYIKLAPPDKRWLKTVLTGCMCTSFKISAVSGTDGGVYKFSYHINGFLILLQMMKQQKQERG
ncbi:MAG: hypothetical protein CM15mV137_210 [uncultured marine virus]|nr:MAG: hypothetical protein CM15mV137_210 [uncultured marine virus]